MKLLEDSKDKSKKELDKIYQSVSEVVQVTSIREIPQVPQDFYITKHQVSQEPVVQLNEVWVLLEKAKRNVIESQAP